MIHLQTTMEGSENVEGIFKYISIQSLGEDPVLGEESYREAEAVVEPLVWQQPTGKKIESINYVDSDLYWTK